MSQQFDIIVFGASGFTGRLVAEYLATTYPTGVCWAMGGRSLEKLAQVRDEIGAPADTPLVVCDSDDAASLKAMVTSTKVVLTTVGPYQLYGNGLVAACAEHGTDYVDLCGEPAWMRKMIDAHEAAAKASGARIVFSCGFDSIPFDLGVQMAQEAMIANTGSPATKVKGRVRKMKGTFSGGTAASLKATMAAAMSEPGVLDLLRNPFALTPGFEGPTQPHGMKPYLDEEMGVWVAPFVMAPINTRNVHRTNALLGHKYGAGLVYEEMMVTGPGEKGEAMANAIAGDKSLGGEGGPKPGEGPSKEERETGFYDVLFIAQSDTGAEVQVAVTGDRDPGYGSTSKMIAESALCLINEAKDAAGGIWTPGAVMGPALRARLVKSAGLTFDVVTG
ncbi:COG3268 Uncharacterized conserved protein [Caulobacteraceae bacterium]